MVFTFIRIEFRSDLIFVVLFVRYILHLNILICAQDVALFLGLSEFMRPPIL